MTRTVLHAALFAAAMTLLPAAASAEKTYGTQDAAGRPPALALEAGPLTVYFSARAQVQGALFVMDDALFSAGDAAEVEGIRLRRARLGASAKISRFRLGVEVDLLETEGSALHEAYVGYVSDYMVADAGVVKVPMSRTALISSEALQMAERPLGIKGLAPFQQLGLNVGGKVWRDRVRLTAGVFNGLSRAQTFSGGWERISPQLGNRFGGWAVAARLDVEPMGVLTDGYGDLGHTEGFVFGVGGGFLYSAGTTIESLAFSADVAAKFYGGSIMYEFMQLTTKPTDSPTQGSSSATEVTRRTFLAQAGYAAWKDYIDVAVRWEMVDENVDVKDAGDYMAIAGAVSGYVLEGYVKMQLQYQHRIELEGPELDNDVLLLSAEGRF